MTKPQVKKPVKPVVKTETIKISPKHLLYKQFADNGHINVQNDRIFKMPNQWPKVFNLDKKTGKSYICDASEVMKQHWKVGDALSNAFQPGFYAGNINLQQINSLALDNVFLSWGELSLLQQNAIVQQICAVMSESMTSNWIDWHHNDKSSQDKINKLKDAIVKFKIKDLIKDMLYRTFLLGTTYISPKIKGDETDVANELFLAKAKLKKGTLEAFYVIEPTWVIPIEFNMTNPRAENFYRAGSYVVFGQKIHKTRMKQMRFIDPTDLMSSIYLFGGMPPIQQLLPYILDFINTKKEVVKIISRYNISVLQTDMDAIAAAFVNGQSMDQAMGVNGANALIGRAQAFNAFRNNEGLFVIDKEEQFTQIQMQINGLTDILQQQGEYLSLLTRIPVSKLFGQAPRGLNSTGEFDANNFNELIKSVQEGRLRPILDWIFKLIQLDTFGEIDEALIFKFLPLGELNPVTQSQLKDAKVNRKVTLAQAGVLAPKDVQEQIQQDEELSSEFQTMTDPVDITQNDDEEPENGNAKDQNFF